MPIHMDSVSKSFDNQSILRDFTAIIEDRGVTAFTGRSGIGKTTLLHLLLGLEKADSGTIAGLADLKVAAVFQEDRLLPWATALQNVALVLPDENKKHATAMLSRLGLGDELHKKTGELSGGMQRRVALARALVVEPDLLILDEPFTGLDEALKREILELLRDYSHDHAVVLVSHDPDDAMLLNARVYVLREPDAVNR